MNGSLSVSELTQRIQQALAAGLGSVRVRGEVSKFTAHRSGHWYFAIQDGGAVLNCVMFRGNNRLIRTHPRVGEELLLSGEIEVYAPQGRYSLIVRRMEQSGAGDLQARIEALKRKLQAEGLMDVSRKRPLPVIPRAIGVATSPTGAAFADITRVLGQRFPGIPVYLSPCRVQGDRAPGEIIQAIQRLVDHGRAEVLIVGRGGGSPEDLAAFSDEAVVRAVAASPVPIVSAVGHEVDISICDLVADARAATPSHAAELVVPEQQALLLHLDALDQRMLAAMSREIRGHRKRLDRLVLRHPGRRVRENRQRLAQLGRELGRSIASELDRSRRRLELQNGKLRALSPQAVLSRGYSVVLKEGRAITSVQSAETGDRVELRLADGQLHAEIR
jgi:exodeoxyribonuclease VII large subunit